MSDKILVIDDEVSVCDILKETLNSEGYDVETVTRGSQALDVLSRSSCAALLVDIRIEGEVSGIDIIKHFRERPSRPKILVISATAKSFLEPVFKEEGISDLIDGILEKPRDMLAERLVAKLKQVLRAPEGESKKS